VELQFTLNGEPTQVEVPPFRTLLTVLLEDLGLTGAKDGCGIGECGSCTILVDGEPVFACLEPSPRVSGRSVSTVEGLSGPGAGVEGTPETLHPVQEALIEMGTVQCGFCIPAMTLTALALLKSHPRPTRTEVQQALSGILCRCTGYNQIISSVLLAAKRMRSQGNGSPAAAGEEKRLA
jgi:carbon-monoxide dehydrogenase small subunit